MKQQYALVTGASMGLGRAFANELASRGYNLLLVSLPNEGMAEIAEEYRQMGIECAYAELDLTNRAEIAEFVTDVNDKYDISILINNAGFGGSHRFESATLDYIYNMIQLNVTASTTLIHELLPNLLRQPKSYILNISSMASLIPSGYKTVYPATKAFIRHLSFGLRSELKKSGVNVCVATLGPMPTKKEIADRIDAQGLAGKCLTIDPKDVARLSINALLRGDREIIVGGFNKALKLLISVVPMRLVAKVMNSQVEANEI